MNTESQWQLTLWKGSCCIRWKAHRASFNFTDNAGICGIPGLPTCGTHLTVGAKIGIGLGACAAILLIATCITCWWKRRQNILRAQRIADGFSNFIQRGMHLMRNQGPVSIEMYKRQEAIVTNILEQLLRMDLPCLPD